MLKAEEELRCGSGVLHASVARCGALYRERGPAASGLIARHLLW